METSVGDLLTMANRPTILFVTPWDSNAPAITGGAQRLRLLLDSLGRFADVTVHRPPAALAAKSLGLAVDEASNAAMFHRNLARALGRDRFRADVDLTFFHRPAAAWWLGYADPKRSIVDLDDIPSQARQQSAAKASGIVKILKRVRFELSRRNERRNLNAFSLALVCSEDDARYLNHPRVAVVPNAFVPPKEKDLPLYPDQPSVDDGRGEKLGGIGGTAPPILGGEGGGLLFVGTLAYPPNVKGLDWFVRRVLPIIRQSDAKHQLTVVGKTPATMTGPAWDWKNAPGVCFVGTVPLVPPYIRQARLEICPLLEGRGTRIKILESLAMGCPVVSTTVGAYGLPLGPEQGLVRCDDPESFAKACLGWLNQPESARSDGLAGQQVVRQRYHPDTIGQELERLVRQILDR